MILRGRKARVGELRQAVDVLPADTRRAMLTGLGANEKIIAGAYTSSAGGVCPMLAAHRLGADADGASFAREWDRFTGARWARPAKKRDVDLLATMLEGSLSGEAQLNGKANLNGHAELNGKAHGNGHAHVNGHAELNGQPASNGANGHGAPSEEPARPAKR